MSLAQNMIDKITSRYTQNSNSNIGKLISIVAAEIEDLNETNSDIQRYQDIDNAVGRVLDRYGQDVGQERQGMDDQSYRFMIKTKDRANFSNGDIETINEMMSTLMGESYLGLAEAWTSQKYGEEPAALVLYYDTDYFRPVLRFDGSAKYDGEYYFNGMRSGEFATEALGQVKVAMSRIAKKGVKIYFGIPQFVSYNLQSQYGCNVKTRSNKQLDVETNYHVQHYKVNFVFLSPSQVAKIRKSQSD